jgi:hypothetical protein
MPVSYVGTTALSSSVMQFNKTPEQYAIRIDPEVASFSTYYMCFSYIRDFLELTYDFFPNQTSECRDATRRIARALSKGISGIAYESEDYNSIALEIFLGKMKILLNELENDSIRFKNVITKTSLENGGVEISFTQDGFAALENFENWNLVYMVTKGTQKTFPFPLNSEIIRLLSGTVFVRG